MGALLAAVGFVIGLIVTLARLSFDGMLILVASGVLWNRPWKLAAIGVWLVVGVWTADLESTVVTTLWLFVVLGIVVGYFEPYVEGWREGMRDGRSEGPR